MSSRTVQQWLNHALCLLAIGLAWAPGVIRAASDAVGPQYALKIASRPLDEALQEITRQTGIQIIYFSRLTHGVQAPALDGQYTISAAMGALLTGSKLTFRVINPSTVEIKSLPAADSRQVAVNGSGDNGWGDALEALFGFDDEHKLGNGE